MPTYNVTVTDQLRHHEADRPNIATTIPDDLQLSSGLPIPSYLVTLANGVGFHDTNRFQWQAGALISDLLKIHETVLPVGTYHRTASDKLLVHDLLLKAYPVTLSMGLGLHDGLTGKQATAIVSQLLAHDTASARAVFGTTLTTQLRFHDALAIFLGRALAAGVGIHDAFSLVYRATAQLSNPLNVHDALSATGLFTISLSASLGLHDANILKMIYKGDALLDGIDIVASFVDPGGGSITWAINTRTGAVSEYSGYLNFNSVAKFGHRYIAADSTGLWALDGELDDTLDIPTRIRGGWMQLAGSRFTSFKAAYLGVRTEDDASDFLLKLYAGDGRSYTYAVTPQNMQTTKVHMGKGLRARYFSWELTTAGSDYDLDSIEFVPISSKRRV